MEKSVAETIDFLTYLTRNVQCSFTSRHIFLNADSLSAIASATLVVL